VQTFGTGTDAEWQAHDLEPAGASTRFRVRRGGSPFGSFEVPLVGAHNVRNALAAVAIAVEVGISPARIGDGLRAFAGVKRRLEIVGVADGVTVYDDFAHHPTAVAENIDGPARIASRRADLGGLRAALGFVVPPHLPGRLRARLRGADEVLIAPIFRSKLPESERLSVPQLVRDLHGHTDSGPDRPTASSAIVDTIVAEHRAGDVVVLMSNGGFRRHSPAGLLRALGSNVTRRHTIVPAGDSVFIVEFEARIDPAVNASAIALAEAIQQAQLAGGARRRACIPIGRDLFRNPLRTPADALMQRLETEAARARSRPRPDDSTAADSSLLRRSVWSGSSSRRGVRARVPRRRRRCTPTATYRVFMLGFVPGFAYLGHRRPTDRDAAPLDAARARAAGSVGIAGVQTGVYPAETPGGWQLIGRTPVKPFDPVARRAVPDEAGDAVQFYPIDRASTTLAERSVAIEARMRRRRRSSRAC
jgi:hypothetical protein